MEAKWRLQQFIPILSKQELDSLHLFHVELLKANQKLSLISSYTEKNADLIHFYDCVKSSEFIKNNSEFKNYYDLGSGNGFPGVVLAILNPTSQIHLVETDSKKTEFLKQMIDVLKLKNAHVLNIKAEELSIKQAEGAVCRGFSNLARTLLLSNKILPKGSIVFSLKGADWFSELASLPAQLCSTWNTEMAIEYDLPENLGIRVLLKSVRKN